ncbi:MAG: glycogen synthase, partial [Bacteroidales bacterium]|nr:glycogen synthase [Bacteroidales bacterium]
KKAFKEDPLFNHSKVVYTLYNDQFDKPFSPNFKQKALIEGVTRKDISVLDHPDYTALSKLAVNFSDGIIEGSEGVSEAVKAHALKSGKPFLPYQAPSDSYNYIEDYAAFYRSLLESKK